MQRVSSFQTARGFAESSEFITKRVCFFQFSVDFLSLMRLLADLPLDEDRKKRDSNSPEMVSRMLNIFANVLLSD